MKRRALLFAAALAGCGGGAPTQLVTPPVPTPPPAPTPVPPPVPPPPAAWTTPSIKFDTSQTFDLAPSLPASIKRGGVFSVSPTGVALPSQTTLSPAGVLSAKAAATVSGVIFQYVEP